MTKSQNDRFPAGFDSSVGRALHGYQKFKCCSILNFCRAIFLQLFLVVYISAMFIHLFIDEIIVFGFVSQGTLAFQGFLWEHQIWQPHLLVHPTI